MTSSSPRRGSASSLTDGVTHRMAEDARTGTTDAISSWAIAGCTASRPPGDGQQPISRPIRCRWYRNAAPKWYQHRAFDISPARRLGYHVFKIRRPTASTWCDPACWMAEGPWTRLRTKASAPHEAFDNTAPGKTLIATPDHMGQKPLFRDTHDRGRSLRSPRYPSGMSDVTNERLHRAVALATRRGRPSCTEEQCRTACSGISRCRTASSAPAAAIVENCVHGGSGSHQCHGKKQTSRRRFRTIFHGDEEDAERLRTAPATERDEQRRQSPRWNGRRRGASSRCLDHQATIMLMARRRSRYRLCTLRGPEARSGDGHTAAIGGCSGGKLDDRGAAACKTPFVAASRPVPRDARASRIMPCQGLPQAEIALGARSTPGSSGAAVVERLGAHHEIA